MDSQGHIQLQRMPFRDRLEEQFRLHQRELEKGLMQGRVGIAPVRDTMAYKKLDSHEFEDVLIFGSNSYLGLSHDPYVIEKVKQAAEAYGIGTGGSPAFSGYTEQHQKLEKRLATYAGHE